MPFSPGQVISQRYKVVKKLGEGGFGAVYLVEDTRLAGRKLALKQSFETNPDAAKQFKFEAEVLARLSHPGLVRVSDQFEDHGQQFLVMDFVEGRDLTDAVKNGNEPPEKIIAWTIEVCDAVAYLHAQTPPIIHRDIKPPNIKIRPDGHAILVDFGIAKQGGAQRMTAVAAKGVSQGFSPPEQYQGGTDVSSDVYALGATLYWALTGVVPPESLSMMLGSEPLVPPRRLNPRITPAIEQVIVKAMSLRPHDRFASGHELGESLKLALQFPQAAMPSKFKAGIGLVCFACGKPVRSIAKFCSHCGVNLTPVKPPERFSQRVRPSISGAMTIPLAYTLEQAKLNLFWDSRSAKMQSIVNSILNVNVGAIPQTYLLRGIKGFGGTMLAMGIRSEIMQSKGANLVARVILPEQAPADSWAPIIENLLQAFKQGAGNVNQRLRKAIEKYHRDYVTDKTYGQAEKSDESEIELSFPGFTLFGVGVKSGVIRIKKDTTSKPIMMNPVDEKQRGQILFKALGELVHYLTEQGARVVIIIDKLIDVETLRPLKQLINTPNLFIITVADQAQYERWKNAPEHRSLVGDFGKIDNYIGCYWEMPRLLCEKLVEGRKEADSMVFRQFVRYIEFKGRGLPDSVIRAVVPFYADARSARAQGLGQRIFQPSGGDSPILHLSPEHQAMIFSYAEIQDLLSEHWAQILASPDGARITWPEYMDAAKVATYNIIDWLSEEAQKGNKHDRQGIIAHAIAQGDLLQSQQWVIENALSWMEEERLCVRDTSGHFSFTAFLDQRL